MPLMTVGSGRALLSPAAWSPLSPLENGAAVVEWMDASTVSASPVSSWAGRVGGSVLTQGTAGDRPSFSATGINGVAPAVIGDGVSDNLATTSMPAGLPSGTAAGWMIALVDQTGLAADATTRAIGGYGDSGTARVSRGIQRVAPAGSNQARVSDGTNSATDAPSVDLFGVHVVYGLFTGGNLSGRIDGNDFGPTASAFSTTNTRFRLFANAASTVGAFWQGGIGHYLVGSGTLSAADVQRFEGYLLWSCGLQGQLPVSHPYRNRRP